MTSTHSNDKKTEESTRLFSKEERKKWKEAKLLKKLEKMERMKKASVKEKKKKKKHEHVVKPKEISTVSLAVPGSILDNAQSPELRTYLAGQIARAAAIFCIDEVVVFNDEGTSAMNSQKGSSEHARSCLRLAKILQYLECPQYLRKHFFPLDKDLEFAGVLNPLDTPHHLRKHHASLFREGVVTNKPVKSGKEGCFVNIGLEKDVFVDTTIDPGLRVTVHLEQDGEGVSERRLRGSVVSPLTPHQEQGLYWGYMVRIANSLSEVLTQCPYSGGYDLRIGTSERGSSVSSLPQYRHAIVVFGGLAGLEAALDNDELLMVESSGALFDYYVNSCPNQGSRTIRTEEAILVTLATITPLLQQACQ